MRDRDDSSTTTITGTPERREAEPKATAGAGKQPEPLQHLGMEGTADDPREQREVPANFVPVRLILQKLLGLHERAIEMLAVARSRCGDARETLLLDGLRDEEDRVAETLGEYLALSGTGDPIARDTVSVLDSFEQYADLVAFEEAAAELEQAAGAQDAGKIRQHVESAQQWLIRAVEQLAERSELPSVAELFARLGELERSAAKRSAANANAALDL